MTKVFITGISGFAGSYLARYLRKKDISITGTYLMDESLKVIEDIKDRLSLIKVDLQDATRVLELINTIKPDLVFHLAALTSPGDSFNNPVATIQNNIAAQINILEGIKKAKLPDTKILIVSSAEVYGLVKKEDLPIDEDTKLMPTNPYAVSKIAQDFLGLQYFLSYKIKVIRVRPFNHIGPGQSPSFVVPAFAKKIAEIEKGQGKPTLLVGSLDAKRDFTDVRDMVRAYSIIIEKGKPGEVYNIGSGKSYKIADILDRLLSFSKSKIAVKIDKSLFRPSDNPELLCDANKFIRATGWSPEISIDTTLKDTLDYWRNII